MHQGGHHGQGRTEVDPCEAFFEEEKSFVTPVSHRCLGSTQHLKNKYGGGYMLEIKLRDISHMDSLNAGAWMALEDKLETHFPNVELVEAFADRRTYSIPQSSVTSLASAFSHLESCE